MKANEFVKKHGLAEVKILLTSPSHGFFFKEDFYNHYGFDIYDDLKRLVESHDLVESIGGLDYLKKYIDEQTGSNSDCPLVEQLFIVKAKAAIADVESCQ